MAFYQVVDLVVKNPVSHDYTALFLYFFVVLFFVYYFLLSTYYVFDKLIAKISTCRGNTRIVHIYLSFFLSPSLSDHNWGPVNRPRNLIFSIVSKCYHCKPIFLRQISNKKTYTVIYKVFFYYVTYYLCIKTIDYTRAINRQTTIHLVSRMNVVSRK